MMIGDQAVGKTAMLVRYTEDDFKESVLPTIGIDFKVKACISPARSARCRYNAHKPHTHTRALCTADRPDRGKEGETADMGHGRTGAFSYDYASVLQGRHGHLAHIRAIAPIHTQKGTGRCLRATYTSLYTSSYISSHISPQDVTNSKTLQNVRNWVRNIEGNAPQTVNKILVGNKCDMESERQVPRADGEKLASEYGIKFYETSARSNTNVSEAFLTLATDVVARLVANGGETSNSGLSVGQTRQGAKNSPCC
mmetsp:Transcript_23558/g.64987  ORF Transcript_23558/g.64987 Transcript_23558/m.64987 type:complete len:254 (+) Transcript_23558:156-917(+)